MSRMASTPFSAVVGSGKTGGRDGSYHFYKPGINPYEEFDAFLEIASREEIRFIVSNTTEAESFWMKRILSMQIPPKLPENSLDSYGNGINGWRGN
jgi:hypothetical protein